MLGMTNKKKGTRQIINGKGTKKSRKDISNCRDSLIISEEMIERITGNSL